MVAQRHHYGCTKVSQGLLHVYPKVALSFLYTIAIPKDIESGMKRGREADVIHRNWMLNVDEIVKFKYKNIKIHENVFFFLKNVYLCRAIINI